MYIYLYLLYSAYTVQIIVILHTECFSTTDIFDLLIFQLKQPDNLAINILLVKINWDIYILSKIPVHLNFSKLV